MDRMTTTVYWSFQRCSHLTNVDLHLPLGRYIFKRLLLFFRRPLCHLFSLFVSSPLKRWWCTINVTPPDHSKGTKNYTCSQCMPPHGHATTYHGCCPTIATFSEYIDYPYHRLFTNEQLHFSNGRDNCIFTCCTLRIHDSLHYTQPC